jgi:hypothetical protein
MTDAEDYGLWWKLSKITLLANLPIVLLLYRQHDNNITKIHSQNRTQKAAQINQAIIKEVLFEEVDYNISYDMFYQRNQTYQQTENISLLIYKIYQKFKQKYNLTKPENHYLKHDAATKIFTFSRPYIRDIKSWRFLILAFSLNPNLALKFIKGLFGNS